MSDDFTCPHCGADVPSKAPACPECGSDKQTGWSENAAYGDLFSHDDTPPPPSARSRAQTRYWIAILAAITLSAYLAYSTTWGIYLIPLVLVAIGVFYYVTQMLPGQGRGREDQLYKILLRKARGDQDLVARLIAYEQQRNPGADRPTLLQNAIDRWDRDRR